MPLARTMAGSKADLPSALFPALKPTDDQSAACLEKGNEGSKILERRDKLELK